MLDYKELKEVDLKLFLLKGESIKLDNLIIKPYTLKEIVKYRFTKYMENLQWISISIDDFISSVEDESKRDILKKEKDQLRAFDFYTKLGGQDMLNKLVESLKMIFRTNDIVVLEENVIAINFEKKKIININKDGDMSVNNDIIDYLQEDELTILHRDNFDDMVEIIKLQNYLKKPSEVASINPVDDETRKLIEDMEKHKQRVEAKKRAKKMAEQGDDGSIDISEIISAVSSKSNSINKFNIWDFTLYQLYDEYSRLELIDSYEFSIKAMLAGAENVDLKHWSSKI